MRHSTDRVDENMARLQRVDDQRLEHLVDTPAAKAMYEEVVSMVETPSGASESGDRRRSRRIAMRVGIAVAVVAVAAAVLSVVNPFGKKGPSIVGEAGAIEKAAAVLSEQTKAILHVKTLGSQTNPDGSTVSWSDESWQLTSAPFTRRQVETGFEGIVAETSCSADAQSRLYDVTTNTIYVDPTQPADTAAAGQGTVEAFRQEALDLLSSGKATIDGHETVDGRDALRIVASDRPVVYLVDAATYDPIEWRTKGDGGSTSLRFAIYETLPASGAALDLLDIAKQHPGAKLDTDPAHYQDAMSRLFPGG